jgi:hypothetical protein
MRRELTPDEITAVNWWLKGIATDGSRLGERSLEKAASIEEQFKQDGMLSDAQLDLLQKLYNQCA